MHLRQGLWNISPPHQTRNHSRMNKPSLNCTSFPVSSPSFSGLLAQNPRIVSTHSFCGFNQNSLVFVPARAPKSPALVPTTELLCLKPAFLQHLSLLPSLLKHLYQFLFRTSHSPNFPLSLLAGLSQAPLRAHYPSPDFET